MIYINRHAGQHIVSNSLLEKIGDANVQEYLQQRITYVETGDDINWLNEHLPQTLQTLTESWIVEVYNGDLYREHHRALGLPIEDLDGMSTYEIDGSPVTIINVSNYRKDAPFEDIQSRLVFDIFYESTIRHQMELGRLRIENEMNIIYWDGEPWFMKNVESLTRRSVSELLDMDVDEEEIYLDGLTRFPWSREAYARATATWASIYGIELNGVSYLSIKDWVWEELDKLEGMFAESECLVVQYSHFPVGTSRCQVFNEMNSLLKEEDRRD